MGWDAFGLPAEQYAIKTGTHPARHHPAKNIETFKRQLKIAGVFSYDWNREVDDDGSRLRTAGRSGSSCSCGNKRPRLPGGGERSTGARPSAPCSPTKRSSTARANAAATRSKRVPMRQWILAHHAYADRLLEKTWRASTGPRAPSSVCSASGSAAAKGRRSDISRCRLRGRRMPRRRPRVARTVSSLHHAAGHAVRCDLHVCSRRSTTLVPDDHDRRAGVPR